MKINSTRPARRTLVRRLAPGAVAVACAAAIAGVAVPDAVAAQPEFMHISASFTEVDAETCGFPITTQANATADVQFFFDQAGNLDHSLNHIQVRGTDSANGVSLTDNADFTHTFDFTTEINGNLGLVTQVLVPGAGAVAFETGRVLLDESDNLLFVAGKHDFISGNLSGYCGAFAG
jgi:hypothetical protein